MSRYLTASLHISPPLHALGTLLLSVDREGRDSHACSDSMAQHSVVGLTQTVPDNLLTFAQPVWSSPYWAIEFTYVRVHIPSVYQLTITCFSAVTRTPARHEENTELQGKYVVRLCGEIHCDLITARWVKSLCALTALPRRNSHAMSSTVSVLMIR